MGSALSIHSSLRAECLVIGGYMGLVLLFVLGLVGLGFDMVSYSCRLSPICTYKNLRVAALGFLLFRPSHSQNKKALPERHSDRAMLSHQTIDWKDRKILLIV